MQTPIEPRQPDHRGGNSALHRAGASHARLVLVLVLTFALLGVAMIAAPQLMRSDIERLLDFHAEAWELGDATAITKLYVPTGRFVYGDISYVGPDIGRFVSEVHEYQFEPLDDPVVVPTTWGHTRLWLVAWKARVTLEHPQRNRMSAEGLAIFHLIERDGEPMIRRFEFLTQP